MERKQGKMWKKQEQSHSAPKFPCGLEQAVPLLYLSLPICKIKQLETPRAYAPPAVLSLAIINNAGRKPYGPGPLQNRKS